MKWQATLQTLQLAFFTICAMALGFALCMGLLPAFGGK